MQDKHRSADFDLTKGAAMARRTIFIASSTEAKQSYAIPIAHALSDAGFLVLRWWEVFNAGDYALDALINVAKSVDGAVFICNSADTLWYRGEKVGAPRDNVILELGLFLQEHGRSYSVIVKDEQCRLPSDLSGMTFISSGNDMMTVAEQVAHHFEVQFRARKDAHVFDPKVIIVEADPYLMPSLTGQHLPSSWRQRAFYLGTEGAKGWLSVIDAPTYIAPEVRAHMRHQLVGAVGHLACATFVSLGPGDAEADREVAINLNSGNDLLQYIPVDISEGLLHYASNVLQNYAHVPYALLTDFEERMVFIRERLRGRAAAPVLVGLLGNTLGTLDRYERSFLRQVETLLNKGDYLLLEVALGSGNGSIDRHAPAACHAHTPELRRFYAHGLALHTGEPVPSIVDHYEERICLRGGRSDVPNAQAVEYIDIKTSRMLLSIRHYDWHALLAWIEREFRLGIEYQSSFYYGNGEQGFGIVLLKRN